MPVVWPSRAPEHIHGTASNQPGAPLVSTFFSSTKRRLAFGQSQGLTGRLLRAVVYSLPSISRCWCVPWGVRSRECCTQAARLHLRPASIRSQQLQAQCMSDLTAIGFIWTERDSVGGRFSLGGRRVVKREFFLTTRSLTNDQSGQEAPLLPTNREPARQTCSTFVGRRCRSPNKGQPAVFVCPHPPQAPSLTSLHTTTRHYPPHTLAPAAYLCASTPPSCTYAVPLVASSRPQRCRLPRAVAAAAPRRMPPPPATAAGGVAAPCAPAAALSAIDRTATGQVSVGIAPTWGPSQQGQDLSTTARGEWGTQAAAATLDGLGERAASSGLTEPLGRTPAAAAGPIH